MKEIKEMFWATGFFSLVMVIPVGAWQAFDFLGFKIKLLLWAVYFMVFTVALVENFLRKRGMTWGEIGVSRGANLWRAAGVGLCGAALTVAGGWFGAQVLGFKSSSTTSMEEFLIRQMAGGGLRASLLLAWFMLPIAVCEELFFRGFLFNYLNKRRGLVFAVVASSVFFGLVHYYPVRIVYTVFYGLVWAGAYRFGGGLAAPVIAHYLHNVSCFYF